MSTLSFIFFLLTGILNTAGIITISRVGKEFDVSAKRKYLRLDFNHFEQELNSKKNNSVGIKKFRLGRNLIKYSMVCAILTLLFFGFAIWLNK